MASAGMSKPTESRLGWSRAALLTGLLALSIGLGVGACSLWNRPAGTGADEALEDEIAFLDEAESFDAAASVITAAHETPADQTDQVQPAAFLIEATEPDAAAWLVGTIDTDSDDTLQGDTGFESSPPTRRAP